MVPTIPYWPNTAGGSVLQSDYVQAVHRVPLSLVKNILKTALGSLLGIGRMA